MKLTNTDDHAHQPTEEDNLRAASMEHTESLQGIQEVGGSNGKPQASDWLPMVRDLMASGLSMQQAIDHLASLAVAAHQTKHGLQAQQSDRFIAPIAGVSLTIVSEEAH